MKYYISIFFISIIYSSQIINLTGNINHFSQMNSGTYFSKNDRSTNVVSLSFIQLPSNILYSEFFSQFKSKDILISPRLGMIDYGTLSSIYNDDFTAYESIAEITFHKAINNTKYSSSIGYIMSSIQNYKSSLLLYNIGFSKLFLDNQLQLDFSMENNIKTINDYSNFENNYNRHYRINIVYSLQYLPLDIKVDFLHSKTFSSGTLATKVYLNNIINLYSAKKIYFTNINSYNLLDNISLGLSILTKKIQFNFGVQLLSGSSISYGSSLLVPIK